MNFYKDRYDAVIIGGALAGLSSALTLAEAGKTVLLLEQRNLPGGIAASFMRGGVEMDPALFEMVPAGSKENRQEAGKCLDDMGVEVRWQAVPEAYHASLPGIEKTLHPGFETFAKEIDEAAPGSYEKVLELLQLCETVRDSVRALSVHPIGRAASFVQHPAYMKTIGCSTAEVIETFGLPGKAVDLLNASWVFTGSRLSDLSFPVWAVMMADLAGSGSCVPQKYSHELSLKMTVAAEQKGVQVEYCQSAAKILVKDRHVTGVRTVRGDEIRTDCVLCMDRSCLDSVEPFSEVPTDAVRIANSRKNGLTVFSVTLLLDNSAEALGITDCCVLLGKTADTDAILENCKTLGPYSFLTSVCPNAASPGCTPEGTCCLSLTALPDPEGWRSVTAEDYDRIKHQLARDLIEAMGVYYGLNLLDHILEIVIETPMTAARFTGARNGRLFGYDHAPDGGIAVCLTREKRGSGISGLTFISDFVQSDSGTSAQILSGRRAAEVTLGELQKKEAAE